MIKLSLDKGELRQYMNEKTYFKELKKIIRSLIKKTVDKDLEKHNHIIKCTLFFISKVTLTRILEDDFKVNNTLSTLLRDIEDIEKYDYLGNLDNEIKTNLMNILSDIEYD